MLPIPEGPFRFALGFVTFGPGEMSAELNSVEARLWNDDDFIRRDTVSKQLQFKKNNAPVLRPLVDGEHIDKQ